MSVPENNVSILSLVRKLMTSAAKADDEERDRLHRASIARAAKWENTLEGHRLLKEKLRSQKLEEEEARKKRLDDEEATFQAEKRRAAIERANKMLFDDSDRVKGYHGTLLVSDVLKEREGQMEYRKKWQELIKEQESQYKTIEEARIKAYDEEEKRKAEIRALKAMEEARINQEQLEASRKRFALAREEEKRQGEVTKMITELELKKVRKEEKRRQKERLKALQATAQANDYLQGIKKELKRQEELEEERIARYAQEKEEVLAERRRREQERMAVKQAQRQRIIDMQTQRLEDLQREHQDLVEKQVAEKHQAEDLAEQIRLQRKRDQQEAIDRNRQAQLEAKRRLKEMEQAEKREQQKALSERDKQLSAEEEEIRLRIQERSRIFADFQRQQMSEYDRKKQLEREQELRNAAALQAGFKEDDAIFQKYADICIKEYEMKGQDTRPMKIHLTKLGRPHIGD